MLNRRLPHITVLAFVLLFATAGCREDVTAVLGTTVPYTLYGVLTPQLDTQWVRVYAIEDRLEPANDERLDAVVTSVDLDTGEERVWRDSVVVDGNGQQAHVFWSPFQAEHGHTYRVATRRSDGETSTATVVVPEETEAVVLEPEISTRRILAPVLIAGDAPRLLRVEVVYSVGFVPAESEDFSSDTVTVRYDGRQEERPDGWLIPIELNTDWGAVVDTVQRRIERPIDRDVGVILNRIDLRLIVANEDWNPPGGVFDPDVLVQPGVLSNVENGFGYVVAGYRQGIAFLPSVEIIEAAGFRAPEVVVPERRGRSVSAATFPSLQPHFRRSTE